MHTQFTERLDDSFDFIETEPVGRVFKGLETFWHTVKAAQIAFVGNRQSYVFDLTSKRIDQILVRLLIICITHMHKIMALKQLPQF